MIFVTLGTQDKSFKRLLKAIDREIENGNIKDKVIVQAGYTKYESENMEIHDLVSKTKFDEYMNEADLIITHGGAGSILSAIKLGKKVIAAPRLKRYKEHTNDHQKELINEFSEKGYILELRDFSKLDKILEKSKTFKPKKFESNTKNMINMIDEYIDSENHISWWNKYKHIFKSIFMYLIYIYLLTYFIEIKFPYLFGLFLISSFPINKYLIYKDYDHSINTLLKQIIRYLLLNILNIYISIMCGGDLIVITIFFILHLGINKYVCFTKGGEVD